MKNTVGTQQLRVELVRTSYCFTGLHIFAGFHGFLSVSLFFWVRICSAWIVVTVGHTFIIIVFIPDTDQFIQTSP